MRFGSHRGDRRLHVEMTSMIDVVFLLIIFFMTAARFAEETRADLDLPQESGEQQEAPEEAGIVVNILADGSIIVGTETLTLDDLLDVVADEVDRVSRDDPAGLRLMLRADRAADSGRLNAIIERLQAMGVGAARIATEVP